MNDEGLQPSQARAWTALVTGQVAWLARAPDLLAVVLLTALAVGLAGALALHDAAERALAAAAILWTVATVGGLIASARVLAAEEGTGGLRAVLLAPLDHRDVFLARALGTALVVLAITLLAWSLLVPLFPDLAALRSWRLLPAVAAGALGLGLVGALTGWAALSSRAGELVGPVMGIPLAAPLVIACLHATTGTLAGLQGWDPSLTFAFGYDVAVGAIAYLVAGHVVEVP